MSTLASMTEGCYTASGGLTEPQWATLPTSSGRVNWWAWRHTRRHREGQLVDLDTSARPRMSRRELFPRRTTCGPVRHTLGLRSPCERAFVDSQRPRERPKQVERLR